MRNPIVRFCFILVQLTALTGCVGVLPYDRSMVFQDLGSRIGHQLAGDEISTFTLPDNLSLADGITDNEAAAIALWNNPRFQADLSELEIARADFFESGLVANPTLSLLFPVGRKQFEAAANWSLDAIWLRPRRLTLTKRNAESVAESLILNGLNLVRDTKLAAAELIAIEKRIGLVRADIDLLSQVARIAESQVRSGDSSELDAQLPKIELAALYNTLSSLVADGKIARAALFALMGGQDADTEFTITSPLPPAASPIDSAALTKLALAARPDLRAAEITIESAGYKIGLAKLKIFHVIGIIDANAIGRKDFEIGPGLQLELPIFNRNKAAIDRTYAEFDRASKQYVALRYEIVQQVRESSIRYEAARESVRKWHSEILPSMQDAVIAARKAVDAGEQSFLSVLELERRYIGLRIREADAEAELRRAAAHLTYSIGSNNDALRKN